MERNETTVRTLGKIRMAHLESPHILSLKLVSEPERELVPGAFQPTERRWLAGMLTEVMNAYEHFIHAPSPSMAMPDRSDLALPKPEGLHPIDHFGRAWNVFTHAVEMMGATIFFCDKQGREVLDEHLQHVPNLSLCLRFS